MLQIKTWWVIIAAVLAFTAQYGIIITKVSALEAEALETKASLTGIASLREAQAGDRALLMKIDRDVTEIRRLFLRR